jgi:hypothetical protein
LLVYSPSGTSAASVQSQQVVRQIKNCRSVYIQRVGLRFAERFSAGTFRDFFGPDVVLVPAPRRLPPDVKNPSWPALRICEELRQQKLSSSVEPLLERHMPVAKSALLRKGTDRPGPDEHAATIRCTEVLLASPRRITIVDDVVTRGATLLGCAWVLAARFPTATIRALAAVRTMSGQEIGSLLDPVDGGLIHLSGGAPRREP